MPRQLGHLYVHVPFCVRKCLYCAFYSEPAEEGAIQRYLAALSREMDLWGDCLRPRTVYFGGGTPSLLTLRHWERILGAMERQGWLGAGEWTIECNPATVSPDKLELWRAHGVNRVSLGVQSLDDNLLNRLGRVHSRADVFASWDQLRRKGFQNLNLDLMFAIPGQTMAVWRATLREALAMQSEHLSAYEVTYEEDTPLFEQLHAGRFDVDDDLACDMYDEFLGRATGGGFTQYEVSNLARPHGPEEERIPRLACQHNVNYWRGGEFAGLGPSAASYLGGVRSTNWANTPKYCECLEHGLPSAETRERLSSLGRAGEIAAFGLRMNVGWGFEEFQRATGWDLRDEWRAAMAQLAGQGLGTLTAEAFSLTPRGLRFADLAAEYFLRPEAERVR